MSEPVILTEGQNQLLRGLVRRDLRHCLKGRAALVRKYGDAADLTTTNSREATLRDIYRALGGEPDRISNLDAGAT